MKKYVCDVCSWEYDPAVGAVLGKDFKDCVRVALPVADIGFRTGLLTAGGEHQGENGNGNEGENLFHAIKIVFLCAGKCNFLLNICI